MEAAGRPGGEAEPLTHCVTSSKPFTSLGSVLQGSLRENGALGAGGGGSARADPFLCPQSQDAGTYTCTAKNSVGHARRRVHLTILALPVFTTLPGDRSLRLGDRLWLRCAARGSPPPRIGWTVNDRPVMGLGLLGAGGMGTWDPGRRANLVARPNPVERKRVSVSLVGSGSPDLALCGGDRENMCVAVCDWSHVRPGKKPPVKKTQP